MENEEENIETKKLTIEDFVVKRKIGEGSFGRTYYARDKKSNKKYVLKLSINKND
jgi:serine/threonine protein kinase